MNSNEIVYERKMTGSFMKLRCDEVKPLDEKILLKNNIPGFLKMEKCYVNNEGQYWYDISGVQSLEMRCQYNDIKLEFLEKLVVSICNKMELLENHLVGTDCLALDPQLIHIKGVNQDEEIYFTAYPAQMKTMCTTFQHLMEYMLTKLDHSDAEAIHIAYGIYEKTINGNYSIADIRNAIIEERQKKVAEKPVEEVIAPISQPQVRVEEPKEQIKPTLYDKLRVYLLEQLDIRLPERKKQASVIEKPKKPDINRKWFKKEKRKENREKVDDTMLIHPSSETAPEPVPRQIHPTVCLSDYREHPQGMLSDVFYIGGTKCGALFGEALVINAEDIKYRFKAYMKQNGAVLAKGWLMGLQFATMLENGDYFEKTKRADELAMQIKGAFEQKKVPFWVESFTNQQFVILSDEQKKTLAEKYYFEEMEREKDGTVVRFCTSWATKQGEIDALVLDISKLV